MPRAQHVQITLRIAPDLLAAVEAAADYGNMSRERFIRQLLAEATRTPDKLPTDNPWRRRGVSRHPVPLRGRRRR